MSVILPKVGPPWVVYSRYSPKGGLSLGVYPCYSPKGGLSLGVIPCYSPKGGPPWVGYTLYASRYSPVSLLASTQAQAL